MTKASAVLVQVRGVHKSYARDTNVVAVLEGIDLNVARGEFLALMGPSGSGKTTLLNIISGLDRPTTGQILIGGQDLRTLDDNALALWRLSHVGLVFQLTNLLPTLSAFENVELPLLLTNLSRSARRERVDALLDAVGLRDRKTHLPGQLSGGQEQRVGIARALAVNPDLIVADEPTGDLDETAASETLDLLSELTCKFGKTVIMITHDPRAAKRAHRILHLRKGILLGSASGTIPAP